MQVQPYLNFDGRCEEALDYYRRAVGAEVTALLRFSESPETSADCPVPPGAGNKVMHSAFRIGETLLMASDCHCQGKPNFQGISLSLNAANETEANRLFGALADGGQIQVPLTKTFFSPSFGVVSDKFGVSWMVVVLP